jgi:hypothetical protein
MRRGPAVRVHRRPFARCDSRVQHPDVGVLEDQPMLARRDDERIE